MSITIRGIYGRPSGVIFHITDSNVDEMGNLNATLDSRFRDALTVQEVRARGRDALNITRAIQVGQYNPVVPDQLYPWSYAEGSGFMPLGSQKLFTEFPNAVFPYTAVTRARPPKDPKWRKYYARVGPMTGNADDNWANAGTDSATGFKPYAIRLAARGAVRRQPPPRPQRAGWLALSPLRAGWPALSLLRAGWPALSTADLSFR
jgi:hypothetical protein